MQPLTIDMAHVLILICIAVFLFIVEWIRVDVVAILIMVLLPVLRLVTPAEAFSGFSSNAVISIIAVIIIGAGLDKTGIINRLVTPVLAIAGKSASRIVIAISMTVAAISSFMQNIGAAALFLPAIQRISKSLNIPISKLLMPIGFSAILGGTLTLVGCSPLILLNDLLVPLGLEPFGLFDVTPVGAALVLSGVAYFVVFGRFVLPRPQMPLGLPVAPEAMDHNAPVFFTHAESWEATTPENFTHYRDPVTIADLRDKYEVNILGIAEPSYQPVMNPAGDREIRDNNTIVIHGLWANIERLAAEEGLELKNSLEVFKNSLIEENAGVVEAVVAPRSRALAKTLSQLKLTEKLSVTPLALHRHEQTKVSGLLDIPLSIGDTVLFQGTWKQLMLLSDEQMFIFATPIDAEELKPEKAVYAGLWFAVAISMVLFTDIQLSVCLMTGALGMILFRVLSIDEAYQAVDWRTIFLLAGLIPLGIATEKTGTAAWIANHVLDALGGSAPELLLLSVIAVLATIFTLVISNVGATVLLVPLVVSLSNAAGTDARLAALVVGLATSNSFLLPTHQVNALYMGPGRYRSVDFIKAGGILTVVFIVVMITVLQLFYR